MCISTYSHMGMYKSIYTVAIQYSCGYLSSTGEPIEKKNIKYQ